MEEPRRIVCLHMNQIGDLLFSLPAVANLRHCFPDAHITSVVRPSCVELIERSGLVDEIVVRSHAHKYRSAYNVAKTLRKSGYDLLVLFSTSSTSWLIAELTRAKVKAGFTHSIGGMGLDIKCPWNPPPSTSNNLHLVEAIGCPIVKRDYVGLIHPNEDDQRNAVSLLEKIGISEGDRFIAVAAGTSARRAVKCWDDDGYRVVMKDAYVRHGTKSVIIGSNGGAVLCDPKNGSFDLTGQTPLPVLAALLRMATAYVGVDSGTLHLSAAMGTRSIGLFGPTDPNVTGPQGDGQIVISSGVSCSPCFSSECTKGRICMAEIKPDAIIAALDEILSLGSEAHI